MHLSEELLLDRRGCARTDVDSTIVVRPIGGFNNRVPLSDVSIAGCRVELLEPAELGESLITRFPELEPLVGELRWSEGATAGLRFTKHMHPAVLDALINRLS